MPDWGAWRDKLVEFYEKGSRHGMSKACREHGEEKYGKNLLDIVHHPDAESQFRVARFCALQAGLKSRDYENAGAGEIDAFNQACEAVRYDFWEAAGPLCPPT